jgi:hypothetical protein
MVKFSSYTKFKSIHSNNSTISVPLLKFGPRNKDGDQGNDSNLFLLAKGDCIQAIRGRGKAAKVCTRLGMANLVSCPRE